MPKYHLRRTASPLRFVHSPVWVSRLAMHAAVRHWFLSPRACARLDRATSIGLFVFGDFPDDRAFIGMAIIVAGGLCVARGHRFKAREVSETAIEYHEALVCCPCA